jgi:GTP-binding protein LepA
MDILLNGDPVDAFSSIVYRPEAYNRGLAMVSRLKDIIPRQVFEVPVQAAINGKVIARADIKAVSKGRLGQVLWRRYFPEKEVARKAKRREEAHESSGIGRNPARGLHERAFHRRRH